MKPRQKVLNRIDHGFMENINPVWKVQVMSEKKKK